MDAKITVNPVFKLSLDADAIVKLETAITFYRDSHPALRDADLDQLSAVLKSILAKVRAYDSALRGLTVSTSASEIAEATEENKTLAAPTAPTAPSAGFPPVGVGPSIQPAPPGAPPSVFIRKPGTALPAAVPEVDLAGPTAPPPVKLDKVPEAPSQTPPINLPGIQTGRLASDKPNPGNTPKPAFTPGPPGRAIIPPGAFPGVPQNVAPPGAPPRPGGPPAPPVAPPTASAAPPAKPSAPGVPPPPPPKF